MRRFQNCWFFYFFFSNIVQKLLNVKKLYFNFFVLGIAKTNIFVNFLTIEPNVKNQAVLKSAHSQY